MKCSSILSVILPLFVFLYGCKGSKLALKQFNYTYNSESFGYNDIKKLYNTDSLSTHVPFFNSESLQYLEMNMQGDLQKTVLKKTKDSVLLCFQFQELHLAIQNEGLPITSNAIIEDLIKPVFVTTFYNGKIGSLQFESTISDIAQGLYKDALSKIQLVKPLKKSKNWKVTEENTTGSYIAHYTTKKTEGSSNRFLKKIEKYTANQLQSKSQKIKIENNTCIETNSKGNIKQLNTSEAQTTVKNKDTLSVLGSKIVLVVREEIKLKKELLSQLLALKNSAQYQQKTTLSTETSEDEIRKMAYKNTLGIDNWDTLIEKLSKTTALSETQQEDIVLKFRALFYLHPKYCAKTVSFLEDKLVDSDQFIAIQKALAITETHAATNAIAMFIQKHKSNKDVMLTLIPNLTTTKYPTSKAIQILKKISFPKDKTADVFTSATAQLALGGMAHHIRASDTLKSNKLTQYLIEKMKTNQDKMQTLSVLGNTKSIAIFPYLKSVIENIHTSEKVRLEAIATLNLFDDEKVSTYLKKYNLKKE